VLAGVVLLIANGGANHAEQLISSPPTGDFLNYFILAAVLAICVFVIFIINRRNSNR
jgi:hypothetical protein